MVPDHDTPGPTPRTPKFTYSDIMLEAGAPKYFVLFHAVLYYIQRSYQYIEAYSKAVLRFAFDWAMYCALRFALWWQRTIIPKAAQLPRDIVAIWRWFRRGAWPSVLVSVVVGLSAVYYVLFVVSPSFPFPPLPSSLTTPNTNTFSQVKNPEVGAKINLLASEALDALTKEAKETFLGFYNSVFGVWIRDVYTPVTTWYSTSPIASWLRWLKDVYAPSWFQGVFDKEGASTP